MVVTAHEEAADFVYRHPWATTENDNPIEILTELVAEADAYASEIEDLEKKVGELEESVEDLKAEAKQADELIAERTAKIAELEAQLAQKPEAPVATPAEIERLHREAQSESAFKERYLDQRDGLLRFITKLRDRKLLSDVEYESALAIVRPRNRASGVSAAATAVAPEAPPPATVTPIDTVKARKGKP